MKIQIKYVDSKVTGVTQQCFCSWYNETLISKLNELFNIKDSEKIGSLIVSEEGITVLIEKI